MNKQSKAKESQGYVAKATPRTCQNCVNFSFDRVQTVEPTTYNPNGWWADKNLRCKIGGFVVKKMGTCNEFKLKCEYS